MNARTGTSTACQSRLFAGRLAAVLALLGPTMAGASGCAPQDYGPRVTARIEGIDFNNRAAPGELGRSLADMTAGEISALCGMIVEPGSGDDTAARMALHGLALYVGEQGTRDQRDRFVRAVCKAAEAERPTPVRAFLIRQLQLGGDRGAVRTLAKFLDDPELCTTAAQALLAVGGDGAGKTLAGALRRAQGECRAALIAALCDCPEPQALRVLLEDAKSEDPVVRVAALGALAEIGDPAATQTLLAAADSGSWQERSGATDCLLLFAERLSERGHNQQARNVLRQLMETRTEPDQVHVQCAALYALARVQGAEAVDDVVAALTSEDPELRAAAMDIAVMISGERVTDAYVREMSAASPEARAGILDVLARRGDRAALPAAVDALQDEHATVRLAAIEAVAELGRIRGVDALVDFLNTGAEDERAAAENALVGIPGDDVSARVAGKLTTSSTIVRAALLDVLARRMASPQLAMIYTFVRDGDEGVRLSAIRAVGTLADDSAAPTLLALLKENDSEALREAIEDALAATCGRAEDTAAAATPLLNALDPADVPNYCSLLRVLGRLGGRQALLTLQEAAQDSRPEVVEAAIRAFNDWPEPSLADAAVVLAIAKGAAETKPHVLAMRAFARMYGLSARNDVPEALGVFHSAMDIARRVEEKKLLLSKLAEIADAHVLDALRPYLDEEALRSEAGSAMIGVSHGILPAGWRDAREALELVLEKVQDGRVRAHAEDVRREVAEQEDFVTDWVVAGPYEEEGKDAKALFDIPFAPERGDGENVEWREQPVNDDPEWYWFIDLNRSVGGDNRAAYLRTFIWSPEAQDVLLEIGSDDGVKVWLNGNVVHANNVPRGCGKAQDNVHARLEQGWNRVMFKVVNIGGAWAACLRVRAPDGGRLDGLKFDAHEHAQ